MPRKAKPKQAPKAATGQPYGEAGKQLAAQQAIPLPDNTALPAPRPAPAMPMVAPGALGAFSRPTERPAEPVTAGAPVGAGPGPEITATASETDPILYLEAAYRRWGYPEIHELLVNAREARANRLRDEPTVDDRQPILPEAL